MRKNSAGFKQKTKRGSAEIKTKPYENERYLNVRYLRTIVKWVSLKNHTFDLFQLKAAEIWTVQRLKEQMDIIKKNKSQCAWDSTLTLMISNILNGNGLITWGLSKKSCFTVIVFDSVAPCWTHTVLLFCVLCQCLVSFFNLLQNNLFIKQSNNKTCNNTCNNTWNNS